MTAEHDWAQREVERRATEGRLIRRIALLAVPLFLVALPLLPNGPVYRLLKVSSASMEPALSVESVAVAWLPSYGYSRYTFDWFALPITGRWPAAEPAYGDIVALRVPRDPKVIYLKRVVARGGDTVEMRAGQLVVNGKPIAKEKARDAALAQPDGSSKSVASFIETLPNGVKHRVLDREPASLYDTTRPVTVPAGHVFVLGDNRDNSVDSRAAHIGPIPVDHIVGKLVLYF